MWTRVSGDYREPVPAPATPSSLRGIRLREYGLTGLAYAAPDPQDSRAPLVPWSNGRQWLPRVLCSASHFGAPGDGLPSISTPGSHPSRSPSSLFIK